MPHGSPDYGGGARKTTVYAGFDMAELAARLGSPITHDRRGDVIWFDDFESGVEAYQNAGVPAGGSFTWSPVTYRSGGFSGLLQTDDTEDAYQYLFKTLPYPVLSAIGAEFSFVYHIYCKSLYLYLSLYTGTYQIQARLKYTLATTTLQYYDSGGIWRDLDTDVSLYTAIWHFHTIKLVADFANEKYVRAILNNTLYDLSSIALRKSASALAPRFDFFIYVYSNADAHAPLYIDDLIFTQNEP